MGGCDLRRKVALPFSRLARHLVDHVARTLLDRLIDPSQGTRREPGACHLAIAAVLGWVHLDDGPHGPDALLSLSQDSLVLAQDHDPGLAQKPVGLLRDLADIGVPGDGPKGLVHRRLTAMHR